MSLCEEVIDLEHLQETRQVRVRPSFHEELDRLGHELDRVREDMLGVLRDVEHESKVPLDTQFVPLDYPFITQFRIKPAQCLYIRAGIVLSLWGSYLRLDSSRVARDPACARRLGERSSWNSTLCTRTI